MVTIENGYFASFYWKPDFLSGFIAYWQWRKQSNDILFSFYIWLIYSFKLKFYQQVLGEFQLNLS